jgi:hypothetical protein
VKDWRSDRSERHCYKLCFNIESNSVRREKLFFFFSRNWFYHHEYVVVKRPSRGGYMHQAVTYSGLSMQIDICARVWCRKAKEISLELDRLGTQQ